MKVFDPMRAIFDMLIKRINDAVTLEHAEVAGLCRAIAVIADPGVVNEDELTDKLRAIARVTFGDIADGSASVRGLFTRELFLMYAENRGLGTLLGRFAERQDKGGPPAAL